MIELAGWVAPAATMIAAIMTAANLGTRVTGWGFVVFTVGALAWVMVAIGSGQQNLLLSNAFLLVVDLVGVWRWLGRQARYDAGGEAAVQESRGRAGPDLFALGTVAGRALYAADGSTIGQVVDAMAVCGSGRIAYLVVSQGGLGGVGEQLRALGWDEVTMNGDRLETELDPAALERRPAIDPGHWPATLADAGVGR